jgi:hypothetical protein
MAATTKKTFEQWMKEVDNILARTVGLTSLDLPDCCYRDWYDDGMTPKSAASKAKKGAME